MRSFREVTTQSWRMVPLIIGALCLLLANCAEMQPRTGGEPRNNRETMSGRGLLSGDDGEFVILRK